MYLPPVTGSDCPVIHDAPSLHRKATAAAISSHVPRRCSGISRVCLGTDEAELALRLLRQTAEEVIPSAASPR
jgi:hypothetical protein